MAWTKANVLHRDISIGNILIDPEPSEGMLIDWDLCRLECELASGPTEPDRTVCCLIAITICLMLTLHVLGHLAVAVSLVHELPSEAVSPVGRSRVVCSCV